MWNPIKHGHVTFFSLKKKGKRAGYNVYLEQPERLVENKLCEL